MVDGSNGSKALRFWVLLEGSHGWWATEEEARAELAKGRKDVRVLDASGARVVTL